VHGTFVPKNFNVTYFTSLNFKTKSRQFTTLHITSLIYTQPPLEFPCNYILNPRSKRV